MLRRLTLSLLCVAGVGLPAAPAQALDRDAVAAALERRATALGPASGALAVDLDTDEVLLARAPDTARVPASTQKLFVAAAALRRFGPSVRLPTSVRALDGPDPRGVVRGDLAMVGGGDPALGADDLRSLAFQLRRAGVRRVTGTVLADDRRFDERRGGPRTGGAFDPDIGGAVGALMYEFGTRGAGGPAVVAAARLQRALRRAGIRLGSRPRRGALPAPGVTLARASSPPMSVLAFELGTWSVNLYAEVVVKALGAYGGPGGTTARGLQVVARELRDLGLPVLPRMADGSGLSRENAATPRQLVEVLRRMERDATWRRSLAVLGRTGTLRGRGLSRRGRPTAAAGRCRGKTGSIAGVSALAGVCRTLGGARVAFALMSNGVGCVACVKRTEDRLLSLLVRYRPALAPPEAALPAVPAPRPVADPPEPDQPIGVATTAADSATRFPTPGLLPAATSG